MKGISFSSTGRVAKCAPSVVLPRSYAETPEASRGTVIHAFLRDVIAYGRDEALQRVPAEYAEACEAIDLSDLPASQPESFAAEVAFAYDVRTETAREIGRNIGRAYEGLLGPYEIPGTLDVVGLTERAVIVHDYKTGHADLGPAKELWQLRIGALAAARAYGRTEAIVGIIRVNEDGAPFYRRAVLSELDLDVIEAEVSAVVAEVEKTIAAHERGKALTVTEGSHCKFCPSFNFCPAKTALAREVIGSREGLLPEVLNDENAAIFVRKLEMAEQVLKKAWSVLEERARIRPIPLDNGEVYGPKPNPRESIDAEITAKVLAAEFGPDVAAALVIDKSITKAALDDALRTYVNRTKGAKITKVKQAALEAIRKAGGATTKTTFPVSVHKPKEPKALPAPAEAPAIAG